MDYYSPDNWYKNESETLSEEQLRNIEQYLNTKGYIVVLHKHFCGARGATPSAYEDFDDFREYINKKVKPGDIITVWPFPEGETILSAKIPDDKGLIPKIGAY
jgi:hypothetical protein